jgi:hypothetical protein
VRENQFEATHLNLQKELGMDYEYGGRVEVMYEEESLEAWFGVEYLVGSNRNPTHAAFSFNGYTFAANDPLDTLNYFLTVRMHVGFKGLLGVHEWGWTGPLVGIEWPYYFINVTSKANPHDSEDWVHYYPYPVVGWFGLVRLLEPLSLEGRFTIGYLPNVPSAYIEGGRLSVSVRPSVWIDLPLVYRLSDAVHLTLGFVYQYWYGGDHSVEDGNKLRFSAPGLSMGVGFRF